MSRSILNLFLGIAGVVFCSNLLFGNYDAIGPSFEIITYTVQDTIPLQDRDGDFITDAKYNPFDIQPSVITQEVEYDPESGNYIILEKIGEEYYRTPSYLTFEEYVEWRAKQQEKDYFNKLAGVGTNRRAGGELIDPVEKVDIKQNMVDRLFGGTGVTIEPKGSIDLTTGVDYSRTQNPFIPPRLQRQGGFDFDMDIEMALDGKIGDKMDLGFNYNTQATFDFDNKIKLAYDSEQFSEDDIIKTIEAGDVSLPLRSQLIQGNQSLFGIKTEWQFGKLRVTGIASQQRSEQKDLVIEDGALVQEFEVRPDEYDENRHFFLSHYARDNYEGALTNMPQVNSLYRINNIEVWVTNDQNNDLRNSATVAAIADLGESTIERFANPETMFPPKSPLPLELQDIFDMPLPENNTTQLFNQLVNDEATRQIVNTTTRLKTVYGMKQTRDFEVQNMRKLNPNEFSYHPTLGFISINVRLRPNQVLGVAYEYTYNQNGNKVYKVGELTNESNRGGLSAEEEPEPEDVIYVKMLKSTNQRVNLPSWDLMMKNVYPLGTAQLSEEDFQLDIFFEDYDDATLKRFLPETTADRDYRTIPLLEVFQLDKLNRQGDPQQDGVFDFIPNLTVNTRTGSIFFPVLEPFGESLLELLDNNTELYSKYGFPTLYNNSVTLARENLDANRFVIKGKYKSSISSEISLGAFNIPQGSVTVRAGSQILREGIDYDIDYGIGRIKIINDAFLQQGVPIRVSFEDQSLFSLQQKTMFGLRFDYEANKNLNLGGTYMRLFERPYTEKVNLGDDPINNRVFGLDLTYSKESPFLTKLVDKLPFYSTKEPSSVNFTAEVAALKPGHSRAINTPGDNGGVVSIDDFEGSGSSIPLGSRPNLWVLASTPETDDSRFEEATLTNDLSYGANRAKLSWYVIDNRSARNSIDRLNPYTRAVRQTELFRGRDLDINQLPDLLTFDMTYYPDERGPYNFDLPNGTNYSAGLELDNTTQSLKLKDPASRWGGIMRYLPNNDFQASNFQYIEFWMLNPFIDTELVTHSPDEEGFIYLNLGNVSEDVIKDNLQFYENSIPTPEETIPVEETNWGIVPLSIPQVQGFDQQNIDIQDLGFDGVQDEDERVVYAEYIDEVLSQLNPGSSFTNDPANDNFLSYLDDSFGEEENILTRYKKYNNPEANAPDENSRIGTGNPIPDTEDLNDNRSLEQNESYYEYRIRLKNLGGEIMRNSADFITDERVLINPETSEEEKWYRFRVPIQSGRPVNDIQGFRSIQFIRMYMEGFERQKTFRMAEFELVRNQWRQLPIDSLCFGDSDPRNIEFVVDQVGIEENGSKEPFRYVSPKGIKREQLFSTFSNVLQDEKSMKINICDFPDSCDAMLYKLTELDLRFYEKLQMFVHAESDQEGLVDGDMAVFVRMGKDFSNNYYEYEIPLVLSDFETAESAPTTQDYSAEVWRKENYVNVNLDVFTELKKARNKDNQNLREEFVLPITEFAEILAKDTTLNPNANIKIKGNPSLGYVKGLIIGIRNKRGGAGALCGEVWVNELRMAGLKKDGGVAGLARLEVQLADLGDFTASGRYSSVGWGAIDQRVTERSLDRNIEYDFATNLELGKFLPNKWNVTIPFYAQYANQIVKPKFDPFELDLTVDEVLATTTDPDEIAEIKDRSAQSTKIKTFAFSNVKKNRGQGSKGSPKPWDLSNVSASYSYTQTTYKDEIIKYDKSDDYRGGIDYDYSRRAKYIEPFKKVPLRILKEFNFNPLPNSFSFNTQLRRFHSEKLYRIPDPNEIEYQFDDKRFEWDRRYTLQWDFTKALNMNFTANNYGVVDELRQVGVRKTAADRPWVDERGDQITDPALISDQGRSDYINKNIRDLGRNKNYDHRLVLNYTLPIRYLPMMDWISMKAQYSSDYAWTRASINADSLGNVIQNNQSRSFNATFSFDKLYNKSKYFKSLDQRAPRRSSTRKKAKDDEAKDEKGTASSKRSSNKPRQPSSVEKLLVRPLLSLRNIKFTYKENLGTVVPGFKPTTQYLGMAEGFKTPGWGFVAGIQPDISIENNNNWLRTAADNNWISTSIFQNQQVIQNNTQNYEARIELEPWRDFKINVNFKKQFVENHSEDFINTSGNPNDPIFRQLALRDIGSFEVTYFAMNTLFDDDINGLFKTFDQNRSIISYRLDNAPFDIPNGYSHETDGFNYSKGYGRQHNNVLVPAFIAAYTGQDPNLVGLDLQEEIGKRNYLPKPNWDLKYNGLSKIPMFQDIFSNVSITHGYKSTMRVSRYSSDLQYNIEDPYYIDPNITTKNYFSRLEIPEIIISEQFSPIIGIDVKTKNDMNLNFEYKKTRNLMFSIGLGQLTEARSSELVFGFGFTKENVNIGFLTGDKKRRGNRGGRTDAPAPEPGGGVTNSRGREMSFNVDFSLRDDVTWIHEFDDGASAEPIRGAKTIRFNPSLDYDVNENLTMRLFLDYSSSKPYLSTSYPLTSVRGGLTASFILN